MDKLDKKLENLFESEIDYKNSSLEELYQKYYDVKDRINIINQEYNKLPNWKDYYINGDLTTALNILEQINNLNIKYAQEMHDLKIDLNLLVVAIESFESLNKLR